MFTTHRIQSPAWIPATISIHAQNRLLDISTHVHVVESLVDVIQSLVVRNELVDPEGPVQVVFDTHERRSIIKRSTNLRLCQGPQSCPSRLRKQSLSRSVRSQAGIYARVSLEQHRGKKGNSRSSRNLRTSRSNTDDIAHSPALMTSFERVPHNSNLMMIRSTPHCPVRQTQVDSHCLSRRR
jgi:hypothetical protein